MTLFRSLGAVASASGEGAIDWDAVVETATAGTDPGSLAVDEADRVAIAADVRAARAGISAVSGIEFTVPSPVEVQNRHHWIEANAATFQRVLEPLADRPVALPGLTNRLNTATMGTVLAVLSRHVIGQYDPGLFGAGEPGLALVGPNLRRGATTLDVDLDRFRRWIVFHEVAHVAEFVAAPWLVGYLEDRIEPAVSALAVGDLDAGAVRELDATMTAIEGYAEFCMDRAFDDEVADLRAALDARRRGGGPLAWLVRRLLGLGIKRRQYERGKAFFDRVAETRGEDAARAVWRAPATLPRWAEFDEPARWVERVDP